jgi:hypothetical protein
METSQSRSNTTRYNFDTASRRGDRLLDKNEEKERKVKGETKEVALDFVLPVAQDRAETLNGMLAQFDKSREWAVSAIGKDEKSLLSNKRTLHYIKNLVQIVHDIVGIGLVTYFSADYLNRKVDLLEQVILIMQKQMKDLPAPEDLKKIREISAQKGELEALMDKLKQLEDEAEMEKMNTAKKLDKARQQVMKDIV